MTLTITEVDKAEDCTVFRLVVEREGRVEEPVFFESMATDKLDVLDSALAARNAMLTDGLGGLPV